MAQRQHRTLLLIFFQHCPALRSFSFLRSKVIQYFLSLLGNGVYDILQTTSDSNMQQNKLFVGTDEKDQRSEPSPQQRNNDKSVAVIGASTLHIRTRTPEKSHKCIQCSKSFAQKRYLTVHIRTHIQDKPYKCNQCDKSFAHKGDLTRHFRTHTLEKHYKCTQCDKSFAQKGDLTRHFLTHTLEKPYKCNHCGKSFARKGYLTDHIRTHTLEKPYKCTQCGKSFLTKTPIVHTYSCSLWTVTSVINDSLEKHVSWDTITLGGSHIERKSLNFILVDLSESNNWSGIENSYG